jgi:hypothetical protein
MLPVAVNVPVTGASASDELPAATANDIDIAKSRTLRVMVSRIGIQNISR